ncbi:MAG TPA: class I SAM-dependent methyltransferase [Kofleriaceae bacterium]|nr:class I SAM-dependent methyltransferase [Kofleriaceae bacterium]
MMDDAERALLDVGLQLRALDYTFTTITPETHRRNNARAPSCARSLRDVFGWSRPFSPDLLPPPMLSALRAANAVAPADELLRATVRFSTLAGSLYVHSAYPTIDANAVFFGPDTVRYCGLLARTVRAARRCVDIGCGSGAGGLSLASRVERIVLTDLNEHALRYARVNARLAGVADRVELACGDLLAPVEGELDLVIANPPYLVDGRERAYRDGGGSLGEGLAVRIVEQARARLRPGGKLVLYTGAPIVDGCDRVLSSITPLLDGMTWTYEELDPDVFGEELDEPAYAAVERIAVVALVATVA